MAEEITISDPNPGVPQSVSPTDPATEWTAQKIRSAVEGKANIPKWDNRAFTYVGSTNNVNTVVYKLGATTVATVTYTYVAAGVADNDRVVTEVIS